MILILIKGILIGFMISVPMGPIGVLVVQRTLSSGRWSGLVSGMGGAAADTIFALIAGFGVNYVVGLIQHQELAIKLGGSIVVILMGAKVYTSNTVKQFRNSKIKNEKRFLKHFVSVFILTLTNPTLILAFIAFFAWLNVVPHSSNVIMSFMLSSMVVLGVFIGGSLWWFVVSSVVGHFRNKLKVRSIYWFSKISGGIIMLIGVVYIVKALIEMYM